MRIIINAIRRFQLNGVSTFYGMHLNSLVISGQKNGKKLEYGFTYSSCNPGEYTDYWGNLCNAGPSVNDIYGNSYNCHGMHDLGNFNMFFGYEGIGKAWNDIQQQLSNNGMLAQLIEGKDGEHTYYYKMKLQTTTGGDTRIPTTPEKHGVLTSIRYPNGGYTTFNYENHRFLTATAADGDLVFDRRRQRIIEGGGFRIESVTNWTADGTVASQDHYRYGFTLGDIKRNGFPLPLPEYLDKSNVSYNDTVNHHIGCGEAVVDPNLFTFMSEFSYSTSFIPGSGNQYSYSSPREFRDMLVGRESRYSQFSSPQGAPMWWDVTFSANKFRSLIGGRRPVVYPEVTVYHGCHPYESDECKSKTVYRYDIYQYQFAEHSQGYDYLSDVNGEKGTDTIYFEPLYFSESYPALTCVEHPSERHKLKTKSDYSYNAASRKWELISNEEYKYKGHDITKDGFVFESFCSRETFYPNYNVSYGQIGYQHPLAGAPLRAFYKSVTHCIGKSELCEKSTTTFRKGGRLADGNTVTEEYEYFCSGVLKRKMAYAEDRIEGETCSFVGEQDDENATFRAMKERNMLAYPVASTTYSDQYGYGPFAVSGSRTEYRTFAGGAILPSKSYDFNMGDCYYYEGDNIEDGEYEPSVEILSYDGYGNPTEFADLKTGMHSVILWDGTGRHMAAMIRNAKLSDIGSNAALLLTKDSQARHAELQKLLPNSLIETWDYKPLVGETAHTDESGSTVLYGYDELGRLVSEKRKVNGVEEPVRMYEYNFLNQSY